MDFFKAKATPAAAPATDNAPLVWIDCEMTGLDPDQEEILEIHCIITTGDLQVLDPEGWGVVVHHPASRLDKMGEWCTRTHAQTGLTAAVLASTTTAEEAAAGLLEYVKRYIPAARKALLAGNSVHADRAFLAKGPYAAVLEHLHYRILDVSSIKEAAKRWCPPAVAAGVPVKTGTHRGREDILESIAEARYYQEAIFGLTWGDESVQETPASERDPDDAWANNLL
ncbi:oligoribonuclease [Plectosphaerella cucumerina]|uniref:Oligoribonuclease n=1 Tax=Plectosphaerella cucumerina TaxID=40658 RepID=A0A8K0TQN4_9PEZI|nr:oligoribonuclease [Plectosphaerella cucumerina]